MYEYFYSVFPNRPFSSGFPAKTVYAFLIFPLRDYLIILIYVGKECKLWSSHCGLSLASCFFISLVQIINIIMIIVIIMRYLHLA